MTFRSILTAATIALLPLAASAATLVIPAAGSGPGLAGSQWQTELTLHNTGSSLVIVDMTFFSQGTPIATAGQLVPPRATVSLDDVVHDKFGVQGTGAIVLNMLDSDAQKIAVSGRIINVGPTGTFGQDVDVVDVADGATTGDLSVLSAPSSAETTRFNFGLYTPVDTQVRWELIRANGDVAATKVVSYQANRQIQYTVGIQTFLGVTPHDDDTVHATVLSGQAFFYGSAIESSTGDPTAVKPVRVHDEVRINFLGIDTNEDGSVEIPDANHDGISDSPIVLYTSLYPNFFRIVTAGSGVTYELIDAPADVMLIDNNGTVEWAPGSNVKGTSGALKVRATAADGTSAILTIPVVFR